MVQGGSKPEEVAIGRIVRAASAEEDSRATTKAEEEGRAYLDLAAAVNAVRREGNVDSMLRVERVALEVELERVGNTAEKRQSNRRAMEG